MIEDIKKIIENTTGIELKKRSRVERNVYIRCVYFKFCRDIAGGTMTQIAKSIDMDHSTIVHSLKRFEDYKKYSKEFNTIYSKCYSKVRYLERIKDMEIFMNYSTEKKEIHILKDKYLVAQREIEELKDKVKELEQKNNKGLIESLTEGIPEDRIEHFKNHQLKSFLLMERSRITH